MLIKDQLRVRMEQLNISVQELAKRVGVSNQSVRHWLSGRSFPGKRHVPELEKALSARLDFSQGDTPTQSPTVQSTLQQSDIELFLKLSRLSPEMKGALLKVVDVALQQRKVTDPSELPPVASGGNHIVKPPGRGSPRAAAR